jgi:hypothetical protein
MENTRQIMIDSEPIPPGAVFIERLHNCADCPIRKMAAAHPKSVFARIHGWHKTWWPAWKAHQIRTCVHAETGKSRT